MQILRLGRHLFQLVALAIFVYQMVEALDKYFIPRKIQFMETKDIEGAERPSIFICPAKQRFEGVSESQNMTQHGYFDIFDYLTRSVDQSGDFVSWEGRNNISYGIITSQIFNPIIGWENIEVAGNPGKNWDNAKERCENICFLAAAVP